MDLLQLSQVSLLLTLRIEGALKIYGTYGSLYATKLLDHPSNWVPFAKINHFSTKGIISFCLSPSQVRAGSGKVEEPTFSKAEGACSWPHQRERPQLLEDPTQPSQRFIMGAVC